MSLLRSLWGDLIGNPPAPAPAPVRQRSGPVTDRPDAAVQTYQPVGEFHDKSYRFTFEYVAQSDGTVHAYIRKAPGYGGRNAGAHETHRYWDSDREQHYICYEPMPRNKADAMRVSAQWAERTLRYIRHGTRF